MFSVLCVLVCACLGDRATADFVFSTKQPHQPCTLSVFRRSAVSDRVSESRRGTWSTADAETSPRQVALERHTSTGSVVGVLLVWLFGGRVTDSHPLEVLLVYYWSGCLVDVSLTVIYWKCCWCITGLAVWWTCH